MMHSQNKDIPLTLNSILKIREIIFYPTGGGEITLPNNNRTFTRSNNFKLNRHQNPHSTEEAGAEARPFISKPTGNGIFQKF